MKKVILPLCILLGAATTGSAQKACGTDILFQEQLKAHPEIGIYQQQIEQAIAQGLQQMNISKFARTTGGADTTTYDIPIVIHVVHDYGNEYLKDDDIFNAVSYWADVYMKRNADTSDVIQPFKQYVGNAKIRLHLATKDPNGNPTKGITHEHSYLTTNASDVAKIGRWPNTSYLNIWFINTFSSQMAGAAAYAYYPSSAQYYPYYDGVIGLFNYLNYDKAIPHEIGHCLELQHVWGNNNQPGQQCGDDGVDDTPPTKGHMPGCTTAALYDTSCSIGYQKSYTDAITGSSYIINYPDTNNSQNIMDYTYCQKMFTIGQVQRMRTALTSTIAGRNNLYTASNLAATGALAARPDLAPIADFSVEKGVVGGSFTTPERLYFAAANSNIAFSFKNRSWNDTVATGDWTFSNGATPATASSLSVVNVKFSQPGWATIALTAGSNAGSNTITKKMFIADSVGTAAWGYMQNFASAADMANWPMFNYFDNTFAWEAFTGAGYDDNGSIRYRSFDNRTDIYAGNPDGDHDDVFTPAFSLADWGTGSLNLSFYTAGSYKSSGSNDSLEIAYSINGGRSWTTFSSLGGTTLANNGYKNTEFVPGSSSNWAAQTIAVPAAARTTQVFFRFRYLPKSGGNDFYMDKFSITPYATEVAEVATHHDQVKIYPNPTKGAFNMAFTTGNDGKVAYAVRDLSGKTIYTAQQTYAPNSVVEQAIPGNIFPASGFYLVTITIADKTSTQKLIVQ
ncbi:M43 family zinc metalloprotease [Taibaiella soli]|uniref:PKD domain-containing protein n=1 Tax=Taibaiella soli TaxID=1649169 RepID=A0A2W2B493_9BACT|nr:M43 family zinc metalloprotease [Taibaiella soli]PZF71079.1 hypothetical protein DN068_20490 [Taibaiella soli]